MLDHLAIASVLARSARLVDAGHLLARGPRRRRVVRRRARARRKDHALVRERLIQVIFSVRHRALVLLLLLVLPNTVRVSLAIDGARLEQVVRLRDVLERRVQTASFLVSKAIARPGAVAAAHLTIDGGDDVALGNDDLLAGHARRLVRC